MKQRCVHFVGFRGEEFWSAVKVWGQPDFIHKVFDDRVFTEVGDTDVVVFGPKHRHQPFVWDASAVPAEFTN